ncbi:adenylate/guanylate cyclase domain-containing protein [Flexibacterium corallicola]|uniref:adenylate/guanylate cyclase domain-containing protein n=1 Tax=Flexibacterium corallicola TaxID=3037259 RepID=UPI00286F242B|nr:adenylate/guanylate cyclase domain-containing protein [Pseudovibrio sp. M1P-2-3]
MSKKRHTTSGHTNLLQKLRLYSGLVLFVFATMHFINHAFGNFSIDLMQQGQAVRAFIWQSYLGFMVLYASLIIHVVFSLWKVLQRRSFRLPLWEATQLVLGLIIPYFLFAHILMTRGASMSFGTEVDYPHVLSALWPASFWQQSALMLVVWVHGCLGIHLWLRHHSWYGKISPYLFLVAIAIPILATTGWTQAARTLVLTGAQATNFKPGEVDVLKTYIFWSRQALFLVLAIIALIVVSRNIISRLQKRIVVTYPGGAKVRVAPGPTLLEISREGHIPMMSVCGGKARCSTCRTLVLKSDEPLHSPNDAEELVLQRIRATEGVRLACQLRPSANISVYPLLRSKDMPTPSKVGMDAYEWGVEKRAAIMFIDLRDFTKISENRFPYDVVFLLNRYVKGMSRVIIENGGLIDKIMGDGIMAIFGIEEKGQNGFQGAIKTISSAASELERINADLEKQLDTPLRIGIGLHAGQVILGRIGLSTGNDLESGLTALGDTVNVASRLETLTKQYGVLAMVSNKTFAVAGMDAKDFGEQVEVDIRGRAKPLKATLINNVSQLVQVVTTKLPNTKAAG